MTEYKPRLLPRRSATFTHQLKQGNKMKRTIITTALVSLAIPIIGALSYPGAMQAASANHPHKTYTPQSMQRQCSSEDENNCTWLAKAEGNGQGHSYIVRAFPTNTEAKPHSMLVCIMYYGKSYARHHDYCYDSSTEDH